MKKGMYGFSADPITWGHIDLIQRAARLVDELWVVVFSNPKKSTLFSKRKRYEMVKACLEGIKNVHVDQAEGLLADYALKRGIDVLFRGVRHAADLRYEQQLLMGNKLQGDNHLETVLLPSSVSTQHITSTMTKTIAADHGDVRAYVPLVVKQALEERMWNQCLIAITGTIASGKSTVTRQIIKSLRQEGIPSQSIDLDALVHSIYAQTQKGYYPQLTDSLKQIFGKTVLAKTTGIDVPSLRRELFALPQRETKQALFRLQEAIKQPLKSRLREEQYGLRGLIILEAPMIAEYNQLSLVNNNVILITIDPKEQRKRLQGERQHQRLHR